MYLVIETDDKYFVRFNIVSIDTIGKNIICKDSGDNIYNFPFTVLIEKNAKIFSDIIVEKPVITKKKIIITLNKNKKNDSIVDMKNHIKFYSNASPPYNVLSNFHKAEFLFTVDDMSEEMKEEFPDVVEWLEDGKYFISSEHLWQSLKANNEEIFNKFTKGGEFSDMSPEFFQKLATKSDGDDFGEKKFIFWNKKNNVGIVPKLVANPTNATKLKIKKNDLNYKKEFIDHEEEIWLDILRQKYSQNPSLLKVLVSTGDNYLLEFDKGAAREDTKVYWGGYIGEDGILNGKNKMGQYMMKIRAELSNKPKVVTSEKPKVATSEKPKVVTIEKPKVVTSEKPKVVTKVVTSEKPKVVTKVVNVSVKTIRPKYDNLGEWYANSDDNVYIGRRCMPGFINEEGKHERYIKVDSKWANPYQISAKDDRDTVIKKYKEYILQKIKEDPIKYNIEELRGKNLGCWCHPERCHGDILIEILNSF
jgi:predicted NAD-dependent protein-ADP-ribosyltransferase YbiA (DUF1768 family)